MLIGIKEGVDDMDMASDIPLWEQFGLVPENYADMAVAELPFSVRVVNVFKHNSITTVSDLLKLKPETLMGIRNFGRNCMDEVVGRLHSLPKEPLPERGYRKLQPNNKPQFILNHAESVALGDFSFAENMELSQEEAQALSKYQTGYEMLGGDLALECYLAPEKIIPIILMLSDFCRDAERLALIRSEAADIPRARRKNKAEGYIIAFTLDDYKRRTLLSLCPSETCSIDDLLNSPLPDDSQKLALLKQFLKWCSFDLETEVRELFLPIFSDKRMESIVQMRARKKTLAQIGEAFGVTRERVRQIEAKARRKFSRYYSRIRLITRISAEKNGASTVSSNDIEDYCKTNVTELLYFLRNYENAHYTYDEQLDIFIIGDDSLQERVRTAIDRLPDIVNVNQVSTILNELGEDDDIPMDILQKAFVEAYRLTGDVYHRTRLSLAKVYKTVLEKHYSDGIKAYDPDALQEFRRVVTDEFGNVGMPENDRALTARISNICILCGRGMYMPKRAKYISNSLAGRILQYIDESDQKIFLMNSLYSVFERELNEEGVFNKYYLQGILRELCSDKYYFRRDYVSKDSEATSLYASVVNFIKKSEYPVQKQQIKNTFPGITEIVINLSVSDPEVLNYFGAYLHSSRLVISSKEQWDLLCALTEIVSDHKAHHGTEVYETIQRQMPTVFSRNAAMYPFSAFSILEYLFGDTFQFSRPYIAEPNVEIGRPGERLHDLIYSGDEFAISDIKEFCKEHRLQIQSLLEYGNACNDRFFWRDKYTMVSIESTGITETISQEIEEIIAAEIICTQPISQITCWHRLPRIAVPWTEWLIYSSLNKWGQRLTVATSSNQLRMAVPLIAPQGEMVADAFKEMSAESVQIDDLDNIDDLIADLIELEEDNF